MKRAALYLRVSTLDQHPESQLHDLRGLAAQRGFEIVEEYTDRISGVKARRPGLDQLLADARRGKFDVVLVWAFDRLSSLGAALAGSVGRAESAWKSSSSAFRENIDTGGPLGRAIVIIIGAIAELERNLIIERVKAGMRRAKLEGRRLGRPPIAVDRQALIRDRALGHSLTQLSRTYQISRASVLRVLKPGTPEGAVA